MKFLESFVKHSYGNPLFLLFHTSYVSYLDKNNYNMASRILSIPPISTKFNNNSCQANNSNLMISSTSSNSSTFSNSSNQNSTSNDFPNDFYNKNTCSLLNNSTSSWSSLNILNNNSKTSKWNIGLMNSEGKYLTAENFGYKINATGNTLRKKQKWYIENDGDEFVYLISPLGNYLATDKYGKMTCEKTISEDDCKFYLDANTDGKWSFKSALYGYYFGGNGDHLHCFSKTAEWWTVHLAIHPQVFL